MQTLTRSRLHATHVILATRVQLATLAILATRVQHAILATRVQHATLAILATHAQHVILATLVTRALPSPNTWRTKCYQRARLSGSFFNTYGTVTDWLRSIIRC